MTCPVEEASEDRPDVFISYSHKDDKWTRQLAQKLREERLNGRPLRVAIDETDFELGKSLVQSLERGVRSAGKLVCVLSPDYVESDWGSLEYQIKMLDDPSGRKGLLVPILYRSCEVPYSLMIRLGADFRPGKDPEIAYSRLVRVLGVEKDGPSKIAPQVPELSSSHEVSQLYLRSEPDSLAETLALNLFKAAKLPEFVWSATTALDSAREIAQALGPTVHFTFALGGGRVWSFSDFSGMALSNEFVFPRHDLRRSSLSELLKSPEISRVAIELLNKEVSQSLRSAGVLFNPRYRRYFFPPEGLKPRKVAWKGLKRAATRTVASPKFRDGVLVRCDHLAASIGFTLLSGSLHLYVVPTRTVTVDGFEPMHGRSVGRLVVRQTRRVYNDAFWRDVMFWLFQLQSGGKLRVETGQVSFEIYDSPITVEIAKGIGGDFVPLLDKGYAERWAEEPDDLSEPVDESDLEQETDPRED